MALICSLMAAIHQLDKTFAKSMERIQGLRKEVQAKAKEARAAAGPAVLHQEMSIPRSR